MDILQQRDGFEKWVGCNCVWRGGKAVLRRKEEASFGSCEGLGFCRRERAGERKNVLLIRAVSLIF